MIAYEIHFNGNQGDYECNKNIAFEIALTHTHKYKYKEKFTQHYFRHFPRAKVNRYKFNQ